jgi:hypothetical protein
LGADAVTLAAFRKLAMSLPEAVEAAHMGHPDFRVGGKIFATLGPEATWGMVKLTPQQQAVLVQAEPKVFEPFNGAWGRQGCTKVWLRLARAGSVREALDLAWRNAAPTELTRQ